MKQHIQSIQYAIEDGVATVVGYDKNLGDQVTIPSKIKCGFKTYPVTGIEAKSFHGRSLKSIYLGENITSIGDRAFGGCTVLESVNLDKQRTEYRQRCISGLLRFEECHSGRGRNEHGEQCI